MIATRGRMIPAQQVRPGRLARLLARHVRPTGWGQGLSVPEKMQVAIAETGRLRILAAAAAAALTRPLGIRGVFYHVAGDGARCLDGMRAGSPYEGWVLPPLRRAEAVAIARELAQALDVPVHIVDINDNGGTIRASSHPSPAPAAGHLAGQSPGTGRTALSCGAHPALGGRLRPARGRMTLPASTSCLLPLPWPCVSHASPPRCLLAATERHRIRAPMVGIASCVVEMATNDRRARQFQKEGVHDRELRLRVLPKRTTVA